MASGSVKLELVKGINQIQRDIVFGYIRRQQQSLFTNDHHIPERIQCVILLFYYQFIESKILTESESNTLLRLFAEQRKFTKLGHFSYHLIHRASEDGYSYADFSKMCCGTPNLLCLFHTKAGDVFGGYTSVGWDKPKENAFKYCKRDDKAFIFSIRSSVNYEPRIFNAVRKEKALRVQPGFFCMFGDDCSIYLFESGKKVGGVVGTEDFEAYPSEFYLQPGAEFAIEDYEIFQLVKF